jgi:hypothetical protein
MPRQALQSSTTTAAPSDSSPGRERAKHLRDAVVDVLDDWTPDTTDAIAFKQAARHRLRTGVADHGLDGHRVVDGSNWSAFDLVVGDAVAVNVYTEFTLATVRRLRFLLAGPDALYDHVVIYAYDLPSADLDRWRTVRSRFRRSSTEFSSVTLLHVDPTEDDPDDDTAAAAWHYVEVVAAFAALVAAASVLSALDQPLGVVERPLVWTVNVLVALLCVGLVWLLKSRMPD